MHTNFKFLPGFVLVTAILFQAAAVSSAEQSAVIQDITGRVQFRSAGDEWLLVSEKHAMQQGEGCRTLAGE